MYAFSVSNTSHPPSNSTTTNEMMIMGEEGPRGVYMLGHRGVIRLGKGKGGGDSTAAFVGLSAWGPSANAAIVGMALSDDGDDVTDGATDNVTDNVTVGVMATPVLTGQSLVIEHTQPPTATTLHNTRNRRAAAAAVGSNESTQVVRVITPDIYLNGSGAGPYFVCGMRPGPTASRVEGRFS